MDTDDGTDEETDVGEVVPDPEQLKTGGPGSRYDIEMMAKGEGIQSYRVLCSC